MNSIDLFILIPILWGAFKGYKRGFLLTFISLISFFLALVLGLKFYQVIMEAIAPSIKVSESFLPYIAFFITFALIWFGINKLGDYLKRVLDATLLGGVDNLVGAALGGLKFAFFISLFLWLFNKLGAFDQKTF
ncbi:MAG: CvpA family protein, partial [Bacteroidota bacterium]